MKGHLDVPQVANQEVAIDFVYIEASKKTDGYTHIFFIVETLTGFVQAVPMKSSADETAMCKAIWDYISRYGAPARITADNDIRWSSARGPWRKLLEAYGVELHLTTPYKSDSNGRCERQVREIIKILRAVRAEHQVEWSEGLPLVVALLNARPRSPSGFSAAELFLGRAQWPLLRRDVDCRFEENKLAEISLLVDRLFKERNARRSRLPRRPASVIRPGMYVFVHISRFPSHAAQCSKVDLPWLGPFLVTSMQADGRVAVVMVNNNEVRVDLQRLKRSPFSPSTGDAEFLEEEVVEMTEAEMAAEGLYVPESIVAHEVRGSNYVFKTIWKGYGSSEFT
ncbi:MAG: integrase catalytic domain-containing protein, partial [Chroococcales cyanobacterium]